MDKARPEMIATEMLGGISDVRLRQVAEDVAFMKYKEIEGHVEAALDKVEPEDVIEKGLQKGMEVATRLYEQGDYQVTDLMVAGHSVEMGMMIAEKKIKGARNIRGTVVMHVAENDQHDIGKNIASLLLRSNGFEVFDLGRDVPVDDVVRAVIERKPDMITGSALMTTTMSAFPKVAERLIERGIENTVHLRRRCGEQVVRGILPARHICCRRGTGSTTSYKGS